MPKRLNDIQRKEITTRFLNGETLDFIADKFGYKKLTILRHIKKSIGIERYNNLNKSIKPSSVNKISEKKVKINNVSEEIKEDNGNLQKDLIDQKLNEDNFVENSSFMELVPLDLDIDNTDRKDLSSVPISQIDFPEIVYMIVDKKIELEAKYLKDFPDWQFLPKEDLNRKTIEIYFDIKNARKYCNKDQKVIKVPNTNVFKIVAPILLSKGISRIVSEDKLIALEI